MNIPINNYIFTRSEQIYNKPNTKIKNDTGKIEIKNNILQPNSLINNHIKSNALQPYQSNLDEKFSPITDTEESNFKIYEEPKYLVLSSPSTFKNSYEFMESMPEFDKYLGTLTKNYSQEKEKIELNFTGSEKETKLQWLDESYFKDLKKYSQTYMDKLNINSTHKYMKLQLYGIPAEDIKGASSFGIAQSILKLGTKAKEYIDLGNKPPKSKDDFKKFEDFISKGSSDELSNLSFKDINTFSKIGEQILKGDSSDFITFMQSLNKLEIPQALKDVLGFIKLELPDKRTPFEVLQDKIKNSNELLPKQLSEIHKYYQNLVNSKTDNQIKGESEENDSIKLLSKEMQKVFNEIKNGYDPKNILNTPEKTSSEKYKFFIDNMKFKNNSR